MINFQDITYLRTGNERQKLTYNLLKKHRMMDVLEQYDPILVGTIPIEIDLENSDLDIICYVTDQEKFSAILKQNFSHLDLFKLDHIERLDAVKANFMIDGQEFEIFGQAIPTTEQNGYRHMVIEYQLLNQKGTEFRHKIIELKRSGYKTEPAFARLLGLIGNPYEVLLSLP
ncbi:DUF4269 domain-containing protein [Pedobacter sp. AW1-32]|uniref:DUF4269 domain-containing protein n=1 Tax=Pedobacter sp. AW1-32 TaxID=3383026 RepID=UPI003FEFD7F8